LRITIATTDGLWFLEVPEEFTATLCLPQNVAPTVAIEVGRLRNGRIGGPDGYEVKLDSPYVWFADRAVNPSAVNPSYGKPEYYLVITFKFFGVTVGLGPAYLTNDEGARRPRVGDTPLIRAIREGRTSYLHPVEVARDPSPLDRWSIVRLDRDFPPFLRPLDGGEFVTLAASSTADGSRVHVHPVIVPRSFSGKLYGEVRPATAFQGWSCLSQSSIGVRLLRRLSEQLGKSK
jgi:hypothetical protein